MPGILDLTPGRAPPVGMRKRDYPFANSLHVRQTSVELLAPPRGSSSEDESDGQLIPVDGASDDSEAGGYKTGEKAKGKTMLRPDTASSLTKGSDGRKRALSVEPSNIPAASFTSGTGPKSRNGSQSSQKRKNVDVDDNDEPFPYSQSKKTKAGYGSKPANTAKTYKEPPSNVMIAQVDGYKGKADGSQKPQYKEPILISQRDQRASQRAVKSTQDSSQSSTKSFKQPPPKKVPKSSTSPVTRERSNPQRATRFSAPAGQSRVLTECGAVNSSNLHNALRTVTDKLGISDVHIDLHQSARHDSSAPPTSLDTVTAVSSPLSSLDESTLGFSEGDIPNITSEDIPTYTAKSPPAVCPMCKQPVDSTYLESFSKAGTRMNLRQQAQFCKAHKEQSAKSEWVERGYPDLDWQQLDTRITDYHTVMDEVLSGRISSFYRNAFEDSLKNRRNKTLQESLMGGDIEGISPGYYGGRGAKLIADNIMSRFASKLRRLAASDKLISSGGVSRYVQAVLVPELAVLLIKDDMQVDEEKAREVLRDSVDIGNLLNEEEDEIITDPAPEAPEVVDLM